ncbi:hypothetical protein AB0395_48290 [Streptosporangium sp. NPDC051023]|uniref:hypothetical protein n=1 Tax=Streptosporangium sp. NPDC051023 TaxID=3155410 RepID=UPI00344F2AFC
MATDNQNRTAALKAQMVNLTKAQPTGTLCQALEMLDGRPLDAAETLARVTIIDVLCERHPEVEDAFQAWAEDENEENTETAVAVIVRAARAAKSTKANR